jgi:Acetyltransferase (GNAT) domain
MTSEHRVVSDSSTAISNAGSPVDGAQWDAFVDRCPQGSIYCKSWWLDAVCPGGYELVAIRKDGHIRAGIALPIVRGGGRPIVRMPPLTQTLGPLLDLPPGQKYGSRLTYEMKILRELIAAIPETDEFLINCGQKFTNWLPFHWAGYSQATRYSYVIDDLADLPAVYGAMSDKTRNIIRKAERAGIRIEECDDLQSLVPLFEMTWTRQGRAFPYDWALVDRIDRAALANAGRKIFVAKDGSGRVHAGIYIVYTPRCAHYIMQGSDPELRASGAPLLAHWHAIQFAASVSQRYDFVGSMLEDLERVFRSFGAVQKPYFSIYKEQRPVTLRALASMAKRLFLQRFIPAIALLKYQLSDCLSGCASDALPLLT